MDSKSRIFLNTKGHHFKLNIDISLKKINSIIIMGLYIQTLKADIK
jgi:hypothetical protein